MILSLHPLLEKHDSVAQLVEHYTFNVVVMGSSPIGITSIFKTLQTFMQGFLFDKQGKKLNVCVISFFYICRHKN